MDIIYINRPAFTFYAYVDSMPRGFGVDRDLSQVRLGRIVFEWSNRR